MSPKSAFQFSPFFWDRSPLVAVTHPGQGDWTEQGRIHQWMETCLFRGLETFSVVVGLVVYEERWAFETERWATLAAASLTIWRVLGSSSKKEKRKEKKPKAKDIVTCNTRVQTAMWAVSCHVINGNWLIGTVHLYPPPPFVAPELERASDCSQKKT